MTAGNSRLLVVDASVVQSAGETEHPVSSSCRECLEAIRHICHRVAVTPAIRTEWDRHMSKFSRKWKRSMVAKRKLLQHVAVAGIVLDMEGLSEGDRRTIEKDCCLLEAASAADRVIVTRDDALRLALSKTPKGTRLGESFKWINPVTDGATALRNL